MLSCWQRAVVRASTRNRWVSSGWFDCRNLIATRRPSRRSRARNTVPIPPSPSILIISYWLMRTPGCGAALWAWTPVDAPSNESQELLFCEGPIDGDGPIDGPIEGEGPIEGASEERFWRGCTWTVAAAIAGEGVPVPFAI